jgi:hypothetical protein
MADIITSSGTHIYIGPAVTSAQSDTLVEFQAMTGWTEIGLVESIGEFGDKSNAVTFAAINDSRMRKQKGIRDAGDMALSVAHDPADAGQVAIEAAEATASAYAFKVVLPDAGGTVKYFRAYVMSQPLNIGGNDNVVKKSYTIAIDSEIFTEV